MPKIVQQVLHSFIAAILVTTSAAAVAGDDQCKPLAHVSEITPNRSDSSTISSELIRLIVESAGVAVEVERTYLIVTRLIRYRVPDRVLSKIDRRQLKLLIWQMVLQWQCSLIVGSIDMTAAEKAKTIRLLIFKRSLDRLPPYQTGPSRASGN